MGCKVSIQVHPLPLPELPEVKEPMVLKPVDPKPDEPDPEDPPDPPDWDFDIYSSETEIRV